MPPGSLHQLPPTFIAVAQPLLHHGEEFRVDHWFGVVLGLCRLTGQLSRPHPSRQLIDPLIEAETLEQEIGVVEAAPPILQVVLAESGLA